MVTANIVLYLYIFRRPVSSYLFAIDNKYHRGDEHIGLYPKMLSKCFNCVLQVLREFQT